MQYYAQALPLEVPDPELSTKDKAHFFVAANTSLNLLILVWGIDSPKSLNTLFNWRNRGAIFKWIIYVKLIVFSAIIEQVPWSIVKVLV